MCFNSKKKKKKLEATLKATDNDKICKRLRISLALGLIFCLGFSILMIILSFSCSTQKGKRAFFEPSQLSTYEQKNVVPMHIRSALLENLNTYLPEKNFQVDTERYRNYGENQPTSPLVQPVSTFSIDVDHASYSNARRFLVKQGRLPDRDSIRVEEFINYFDYHYPNPTEKEKEPFTLVADMDKNPLHKESRILRIGLQAKYVEPEKRPNVNLVFLIDVSGSMRGDDRIELLKKSLLLLIKELRPQDRISIVTYAGESRTLLDSVKGSEKGLLQRVVKELTAGGSTAGGAGILDAYAIAEKNFIKGGINRILLASDGDFNVGIVSHDELVSLIEEKRKNGISLSVLGYGMGNYNDKTMEQLADKGNGNYFYIDNILEAKKVLVDELSATLETVASDVKIQVEFNPAVVKSYRLIGYENRKIDQKDFNNDKVDAGEMGAGDRVTALYEIVLNQESEPPEGRYASQQKEIAASLNAGNWANHNQEEKASELGFLRLRYKLPNQQESSLIEKPLLVKDLVTDSGSFADKKTQSDFTLAVVAAGFAQLLRESEFAKSYDYEDLISLMAKVLQHDPSGYRGELLQLIHLANQLKDTNKLTDDEMGVLSHPQKRRIEKKMPDGRNEYAILHRDESKGIPEKAQK